MGSLFSLVLKPHRHITERYLEKLQSQDYYKVLDECAQRGVAALQAGTPKRTGLTAASWGYEIQVGSGVTTISWTNTNVTRDGDPIAILLQYGHGTGTGGYVAGLDYINPSIRPVFDEIADAVWKAVMQE
jgi:hypothetical protein